MSEQSDSTNVQPTTFGFPLIRRVFPNLIANELVSVQPIADHNGVLSTSHMVLPFVAQMLVTLLPPMQWRISIRSMLVAWFGLILGTGDDSNQVFTVNGANVQMLPCLANSHTVYVDSVAVAATMTNATTGEFTLAAAPAMTSGYC